MLGRRQVLRAAGVALTLPWLESLAPRVARAQPTAAPRRYISLYFPNGTADFWRPKQAGVGVGWSLSPILAPLADVKRYVTVLSNVSNTSTFGGHVEPSHSNCCAAAWTCVKANGDGKNHSGISVDQVIAHAIGKTNPLPSIQVGLSTLDSYTDGLPGQHSRSISWKNATEPLYKIVNPQALFDRLTGEAASSNTSDAAAVMRRKALRASVLDYVRDQTARLTPKLGVSDRKRLDQFLTSVRSLEQRVADPGMQLEAATCTKRERPGDVYAVGNVPGNYSRDQHAGVMIDLVVMALACDMTRVVSFMLDDARSDFVYNFLTQRTFNDDGSEAGNGAVGGYHGAQHAGDRNNGFATIGHWNAQKAAQLAAKLMAVPEGDGNLLDNTVITFASGMHGGNHDPANLPVALIGGGGKLASGTVLKTDRHILFEQEQRLADVHLTLMQRVFGLPDAAFGSSSGPIAALTEG
ncbi:MAG: DUF1552 domain-containing protein [Polyangiales bacterium]